MPLYIFPTCRSLLNLLLVSSTIASALSAQTPAPSDIYVGNGYFSGEYYDFFTDQAGLNQVNISDYVFYIGNTYTFHKISGNNHPFYLSDIPSNSFGSYHLGTLSFPVSSDSTVSQSDGIRSSESMTLTIPASYSNTLHYYCTKFFHNSMVASLNVDVLPVDGSPSYINTSRLIITEVDRQAD
jgi:hypothetical protein